MTAPVIPGTVPAIAKAVERMKRAATDRDQDMLTISLVRAGRPDILFPDLFNDQWKRPVVANWIDSVAREFAEMIAPLPALNCSSRSMKTDSDKAKAAKKNIIGAHYWRESKLKLHMITAADRFLSYGFLPFIAEARYDNGLPSIRLDDPIGAYYENDRLGVTLRYAKEWVETVGNLAALFPDLAPMIRTKLDPYSGVRTQCADTEKVKVVQYVDSLNWTMYLPDRTNLILSTTPVVTKGRCPVVVAERPGLHPGSGQYDQVVWVQLARHRMALLSLEAGVKAVGAPLAVPRDVVEMAVGPDAVIQTDQPQNVRRVGIEVPQSAFALQQTLESEMRMGARYPEGRAGGIDASVITGRGVQALMGSFDTQISTAQTIIGDCLSRITSMCFEIDATVWPNVEKHVTGVGTGGEPYDLTYKPAKDIGDNYACDVTYGYAAGLAPNQAIVMLLQLRGDSLVDRATVQRQLPFDINVEQMARNIDVEQTTDAMKQGLFALLGNLGPMAAQGADPLPFLRTAATIVKGRQDGKDLAQLFIDAFDQKVMAPPAPTPDPNAPAADPTGAAAEPGAAGPGALPPGVAPGQAGQAPGGMPDLQMLVAGMRNGKAQLDASVSRRLPVA